MIRKLLFLTLLGSSAAHAVPTVYQATDIGKSTYRSTNSTPPVPLSKVPQDADCSRYAVMSDRSHNRLYCFKRGSRDTLYQFALNPKTQKYEYGYNSIRQVPIKGIPSDANPEKVAVLHDGRKYRLYMMNRGLTGLYQFVYDPRSRSYVSARNNSSIRFTGTPRDANPANFGILHDGKAYRLYLGSRTHASLVYPYKYSGSSNTYQYSGGSQTIERMTTFPNFSMLHDGRNTRLLNLDFNRRRHCFKNGTDLCKLRSAPSPSRWSRSEDYCFDQVQNKLAWSRSGHKNWAPENIRLLCKNVKKQHVSQRIACFKKDIRNHYNKERAIHKCKTAEARPPAPKLKLHTQVSSSIYRNHGDSGSYSLGILPNDADCSRYAMLHDGSAYILYCFKKGSNNTLYQAELNPRTNKFEFRRSPIRIKDIPHYANPSKIAALDDGHRKRLFMMNRAKDRLVPFVFDPKSRSYIRPPRSLAHFKILGRPKDADPDRFAMLSDTKKLYLYMGSRSNRKKAYIFAFDPRENMLKYSGRSVSNVNLDAAALHDGRFNRLYQMRTQ